MKNRYLCPKCKVDLKISDHIIFSAKTIKGSKGILLISPELGNYTILHDEQFNYDTGEHIDLFCPVCQANLAIPNIDEDLAEVLLIDEKNVEYKVIFSEIAGKKCTIKVKDKKIIKAYGDDADEYTNHWGVTPQY